MMKHLCVLLFVCVALQTVVCQSGESCRRVTGEQGLCVSIKNCEYYVKIVAEFGLLVKEVLKKAKCGYDHNLPKVCCPISMVSNPTTKAPSPSTTEASKLKLINKSGTTDFIPAFPDPPVCGESNATVNRVVGGVNAKLNDFPWMALLGYNTSIGTDWKCGGSLISSRHVLTAAHCIYSNERKLYVVRLGELDLSREDEGAHPVDVLIKSMIAHEQYSPNNYVNDIGVLILQKEVRFSNSIRPICIPKSRELRSESYEEYNPFIAGWGRTSQNGAPANHLQVLQLPVLSNEECVQAFKSYHNQVFDERVMCAGYLSGGKDSCQGDSGGPLMQPVWSEKDGKSFFYEIGLVSYGRGCAQAKFPGVYTRVTHFIPWIERNVLGASQ